MSREYAPIQRAAAGQQFSRGVMLMDDLESTFWWLKYSSAAGGNVAASTFRARHGAKSMVITTGVGGGVANEICQAYRYLGWPQTNVLVIRAWFSFASILKLEYAGLGITVVNATRILYPNILYNHQNSKGQIQIAPSLYFDPPEWSFTLPENAWLLFEVSCDLNTQTYLNASMGGVPADVAGQPLDTGAAGLWPRTQVFAQLSTTDGTETTMLVDDIFVGSDLD